MTNNSYVISKDFQSVQMICELMFSTDSFKLRSYNIFHDSIKNLTQKMSTTMNEQSNENQIENDAD